MSPRAPCARRYEERVDGPTDRAAERIAKARFAAYGTSVYPDATFSLRLTYGRVAGWTYRGRTVPRLTNFDGLYRRATGHFPFDLPPRWLDAKGKLDLTTVFNISSENDIIGGNSGSPADQRQGRSDRRHLRRQHPFAGWRFLLRRRAEPRGLGLDGGDHRGAATRSTSSPP